MRYRRVGHVMTRIEVDRDRCVGSGNCLFWAPATFDLDDEGLSVVVDPDGDGPDAVGVAAEGCPTRAITVHAADGPKGPAEGTDDTHGPARAVAPRTEGGGDADRPVR